MDAMQRKFYHQMIDIAQPNAQQRKELRRCVKTEWPGICRMLVEKAAEVRRQGFIEAPASAEALRVAEITGVPHEMIRWVPDATE